jgi:signal transduction histidine kinase
VATVLANAVRHAGSAVELSGRVAGQEVMLAVSDDGPGISEADRERVFERFTRLDDARDRDAGGSGLGLAISRELITRAGGRVSLTGGESGFTLRAEIRLPMATRDQDHRPSAKPHLSGAAPPVAGARPDKWGSRST